MAEETLIKILDLPDGKNWVWYPDANIVALSASRVARDGRQQVLDEFQAHWRRSCIRAA